MDARPRALVAKRGPGPARQGGGQGGGRLQAGGVEQPFKPSLAGSAHSRLADPPG